jgi:hypothetical protein
VDVGTAFVAGPQPLERVQPGETAFNDPTDLAQPRAVRDTAARDSWNDAALAQQPPVLVEVVAAVGVELAGLASGPSACAADRWDRVEQRQQLGDVVAVPAGQGDREGDPAAVDDQVVLGAGVAAIDRGRPDIVPL